MSQTKKGNQWYFGAKMHVGVDVQSGLVHTAKVNKASRHDAALRDWLIREDDRAVFGALPVERPWSQRQWRRLGQRRTQMRGAGAWT